MKPRTTLSATDRVGRGVFSKKDRQLLKREEAPSGLFFDEASPTKISVHRLTPKAGEIPAAGSGLASDEQMAEIGDCTAKIRGEKKGEVRNFYGWGELSVAEAEQMRRIVRLSPLPENSWHADIVLPESDANSAEARWEHAEELATLAVWRPRPEK